MQPAAGRRPGKTGGVFTGIGCGFFRTENDADDCGSFAAVERSMSDRLIGSFIHDGPSHIEEVAREKREERDVYPLLLPVAHSPPVLPVSLESDIGDCSRSGHEYYG